MLALSFTFPAGRYHATPWDRHVNEGSVAWPPDPWRILRGLIATWHHKVKHFGTHTESTLLGLIESLAQEPPEYTLPAASHAHTRHYMPQFAAGKTSLVFDAFASIAPDEPLMVIWPELELPDEQCALLDDLLDVMGYLGRAESWVEARRVTDVLNIPETRTCKPGRETVNTDTGEWFGESVALYAPQSADEYRAVREHFLSDKKSAKKLGKTLPGNLLDAICVDTSDLRKQGWNQPPAARKVTYLRPKDALRPQRRLPTPPEFDACSAGFVLIGKPLPQVENSLRVGELFRRAVMGRVGYRLGKENIPPIVSGHDLPKDNRHRHAFFLPWDIDGDGRIDRLLLHVPDGMNNELRRIIEGLSFIKSHDGIEWRLALENIGDIEFGNAITKGSTTWESVTPYLHPWHTKKRLTVEDQIRRECRERGLPEITRLEPRDSIRVGRRERSPIHFHRFRSKRGLTQPDRHGSAWRLTFESSISGPLALGFGCHYGLGMFKAEE